MTAVLPPIVCRYPFANDEFAAFCDDIEAELEAKAMELARGPNKPVDLSLTPVRLMREFLHRCQMEEGGVTEVSIWVESHAAIHTRDEDNYHAFDANAGFKQPEEPESAHDSGFYRDESSYFRTWRPGLFWNGAVGEPLHVDGGKQRRIVSRAVPSPIPG